MKKVLIFGVKVSLIFAFITCLAFHKQDKKALVVYEQNLAIVKYRIDNRKDFNLMEVYGAILFFNRVTGIISHSGGGAAGAFDPTREDYSNWKKWLRKNKDRLYWDEKSQTVKVTAAP
jgi:hypothetical protein